MKRVKRTPIGATPLHVEAALKIVRDYLKQHGWVEVIVAANGGAVYKLTSIYDDLKRCQDEVSRLRHWIDRHE